MSTKRLYSVAEPDEFIDEQGDELPPAPEHLLPAEKSAWNRFAKEAFQISEHDLGALELLAIDWVQAQKMREAINEHGTMFKKKNTWYKRPEVTRLTLIERRIHQAFVRFGMTPKDRAKLLKVQDQVKHLSGKGKIARAGTTVSEQSSDKDAEFE